MTHHLLIVDDEPMQRQILSGFLNQKGYRTYEAESAEQALQILNSGNLPDLVISDMKMGQLSGKDLLTAISQSWPHIPFIMITAFGNVDDAVDIMKLGAVDYLTKPVNLQELLVKLEKAFHHKLIVEENENLRSELAERRIREPIISQSGIMQQRLDRARRSARTDVPVLITGSSGTGKELFARTVHQLSHRHQGPFIPVNCAALNMGVLESELFGHEKGAFTGAHQARKGRFEMASQGTLFLDEVGDLPMETQVKLLRVLQEGIIERVGASTPKPVDFRLICATHRDLEERIREGQFREDLYYRINVVNINLPDLAVRREDIPLLLDHFLHYYARKYRIDVKGFSADAFRLLTRYSYPGNIRELINIVQKAIVLARSNVIHADDLEGLNSGVQAPETPRSNLTLPEAVAEMEQGRIIEALVECNHVQVQAAAVLGINERTLRYKMEKYGLGKQG